MWARLLNPRLFVALIAGCGGLFVGSSACNGGSNVFVPCTSNAECAKYGLVCDAQRGACRGCTADAECASGSCVQHKCQGNECTTDADCARNVDGRTQCSA